MKELLNAIELQALHQLEEEKPERNLILEHARTELFLAGKMPTNDLVETIAVDTVLKLVEFCSRVEGLANDDVLNKTLEYFNELMHWKLLTPLTGDDKEWEDISDDYQMDRGQLYYNKRYRPLIKNASGQIIDTQAYKYVNMDGQRDYTIPCAKEVALPYTPKQEVILIQNRTQLPDGNVSAPVILQ